MTYSIKIARSAARALTETLPEAVAAAAFEFVNGPLLENPHRVGKRLRPPLDGKWSARRGQYRVIYEIHDAETTVVVLQVSHRSDAYH
ncbi:MAG: type II toxin-antitoxin system RelE/ParE family toxin [Actinomycetota bacterium]|nr:type II toxin-antitoxin system RelE/ParE family toxin [Actinomycetota bacterium]